MRRLVAAGAVCVVLAVGQWFADGRRAQVDLTQDRTLTLSEETEEVLRRLDGPVRITAFLERSDPARVHAAALLDRYRRLDRELRFRVVAATEAPAEAQRLGIEPVFGGVSVEGRGRVEQAPAATEQDVTAALARLLRPPRTVVCATTGHGEADTTSTLPEGLASAAGLLQSNGYVVEVVDLLGGGPSVAVPETCAAVVVAAPRAALGEAASSALTAYLDGGGRALVLVDPSSAVDLDEVTGRYGLTVERGLVLEADRAGAFSDDPFRPIVRSYRSGLPIVRRLAPTFFPGVQAVVVDEASTVPGLTATPLAVTSAASYLEREPAAPSFDEGADLRGPVVVAAAADRSTNVGGEVVRTRVVVVGDADFATNAFVREAANGELLVRSLDWVTLEEDLVTVSANIGRYRPLRLTAGQLSYLRLVASGLVPLAFLLGGALVWAVRRGR